MCACVCVRVYLCVCVRVYRGRGRRGVTKFYGQDIMIPLLGSELVYKLLLKIDIAALTTVRDTRWLIILLRAGEVVHCGFCISSTPVIRCLIFVYFYNVVRFNYLLSTVIQH